MKKHIPNMITYCNLICGCIAAGAAFQNPIPSNYFWAIVFILLGAIFDFFDGMVARALGVSSPIGKELDSLADVVTFGVAPVPCCSACSKRCSIQSSWNLCATLCPTPLSSWLRSLL